MKPNKETNQIVLAALMFAFALTGVAHADQVMPAESEDLQAFDNAISKSQAQKPAQAQKDNFGATVSAEAKKLRGSAPEGYKNFGQWVSGQRRKNQEEESQQGGLGLGKGQSGNRGDAAQDARDNGAAAAAAAGQNKGRKGGGQ